MPAPAPAPSAPAGLLPLEVPRQQSPVDPDLVPDLALDHRPQLSAPSHDQGVAGAAQMLANGTWEMAGAGPVALDDSGPGVLLHWYGDPPAEVLAAVAERYPDVDVEVVPVVRPPQDMAAIQQQVLRGFASRGVGCVGSVPDASALDICVDDQLDEDERRALAEDVERATGVPVVTTSRGNPVPVPATS